jgi:Tfp pilus assembly protein FimT
MSLFELLIVLAIIAVVSAIAIPSFMTTAFPHMKLKRTAMDIYSTLQLSRSRAIGSNMQYGVEFNLSASPPTYKVKSRPDSTSAWTTDATVATRSLEQGIGIQSVIVSGTTYTTGLSGVIGFTPVGTASSSEVRLLRTDNASDRFAVTVAQSTGKVTIEDTW